MPVIMGRPLLPTHFAEDPQLFAIGRGGDLDDFHAAVEYEDRRPAGSAAAKRVSRSASLYQNTKLALPSADFFGKKLLEWFQ